MERLKMRKENKREAAKETKRLQMKKRMGRK